VSEDANVPALEGHCSGAAGPEQAPDASNPRSYTKCRTADPDIFVGFWFARPASRDACSAGKLGILFSWSWNLTWVYSWGSKKLTGYVCPNFLAFIYADLSKRMEYDRGCQPTLCVLCIQQYRRYVQYFSI